MRARLDPPGSRLNWQAVNTRSWQNPNCYQCFWHRGLLERPAKHRQTVSGGNSFGICGTCGSLCFLLGFHTRKIDHWLASSRHRVHLRAKIRSCSPSKVHIFPTINHTYRCWFWEPLLYPVRVHSYVIKSKGDTVWTGKRSGILRGQSGLDWSRVAERLKGAQRCEEG